MSEPIDFLRGFVAASPRPRPSLPPPGGYEDEIHALKAEIERLRQAQAGLLERLVETIQLLDANAIAVNGKENGHPICKRARAAIAAAKEKT